MSFCVSICVPKRFNFRGEHNACDTDRQTTEDRYKDRLNKILLRRQLTRSRRWRNRARELHLLCPLCPVPVALHRRVLWVWIPACSRCCHVRFHLSKSQSALNSYCPAVGHSRLEFSAARLIKTCQLGRESSAASLWCFLNPGSRTPQPHETDTREDGPRCRSKHGLSLPHVKVRTRYVSLALFEYVKLAQIHSMVRSSIDDVGTGV